MTNSPPPDVSIARRAAAIAFALLLSGYLIFNRPFALLGWPPVYIGEMALALALVAALFDFKTVFIEPLKHSRAMQIVALLLFYGILRIAIDAPVRGLDAARDGVICLYAIAAFLGPWLFSERAGARNPDLRFLIRCPPLRCSGRLESPKECGLLRAA